LRPQGVGEAGLTESSSNCVGNAGVEALDSTDLPAIDESVFRGTAKCISRSLSSCAARQNCRGPYRFFDCMDSARIREHWR
jgi:hypothetical protein